MGKPSEEMIRQMKDLYTKTGNYAAVGRAVNHDARFVRKWLENDAKEKARAGTEEKHFEQTSQTKALKMIDQGIDPVRVAWETGLSPDEVEQVLRGYWKLKGMTELRRLHDTIGADGVWGLKRLNGSLSEKNWSVQYLLQLAGEGEDLEEKVQDLGGEVDSLEIQRTGLEKEIAVSREESKRARDEEAIANQALGIRNEEKKRSELVVADLKNLERQHGIKAGSLVQLEKQVKNGEAYGRLQTLVIKLVAGFLRSEDGVRLRKVIVLGGIQGFLQLSPSARTVLVYGDQPEIMNRMAQELGYLSQQEAERAIKEWLAVSIDEFDTKSATSILAEMSSALLEYAETHPNELSFEDPNPNAGSVPIGQGQRGLRCAGGGIRTCLPPTVDKIDGDHLLLRYSHRYAYSVKRAIWDSLDLLIESKSGPGGMRLKNQANPFGQRK